MGWISYHIDDTTQKGRKAEIDSMYTWDKDGSRSRVLRSVMRGSTYYAAVELTTPEKHEVWGLVVLTWINNKQYDNFGYKHMSEDMGPGECKAPAAILDLLTPTTSEYALEWRKLCRENLDRPKLSSLPYGTRIAFTFCGTRYEARKMPPAYQFKTAWFLLDNGKYMPKTRIKHFEIISTPEARIA